MPSTPRSYSPLTEEALVLLGKQIRLARKRRRMSEHDLAARIGVARSALQLNEKGSPSVAIGLVLEAATLTGVDLFVPEATSLHEVLGRGARWRNEARIDRFHQGQRARPRINRPDTKLQSAFAVMSTPDLANREASIQAS